MKQTKQRLLKSLLATIGQNKVCDSLAGINKAFDILLKAQKKEIIENLKEKVEGEKLLFGRDANMWYRKGTGALYTNSDELAEIENKAISQAIELIEKYKK